MPRGTQLTEFEKGMIEGLHQGKMSNREIADAIRRSLNVVNNYIKKKENYARNWCSGRKQLLTPREKRRIIRSCSNKKISIAQLKKDIGLRASNSTIWRFINSNQNICNKKKKRKPSLTKKHKTDRLNWARKFMSWTVEWNNIIFTDEKKFNLDGPDGYRCYWHDLRKEELIFSKRQCGGGSVMVWAGFGQHGKTGIAFLNKRMTSRDYCEMIGDYLVPIAKNIGGDNWIFQRDNAPIHGSKYTKKWFFDQKIKILDWPALSPDLNPQENLWGILSRQVYANGRQFNSVSDLKQAISKAWAEISEETLSNLIGSMPTRVFEVIRKNGASIDY